MGLFDWISNPDIFNKGVIWILGLVSLIGVLDSNGLFPAWLSNYLNRNKISIIAKSLDQMGVFKLNPASSPGASASPFFGSSLGYKHKLEEMLESDRLNCRADVGLSTNFQIESFIDVIGSSTDASKAREYAKILRTHLDFCEEIKGFDAVATPKDGAPILGYELSVLLKKPLILGICNKGVVRDQKYASHFKLDYPLEVNLQGKVVLLVDDSTTGGRKLIELAEALRSYGAEVSQALVLFEPKGKGGREKLLREKVTLFSIAEGPKGKI